MVSNDSTIFTEWRDYFFNDYIIESCNNNIYERKENELDNYDYTVKINQGEFFSFSKEHNEVNKSSGQQTINSQNNENLEIKYLTPFQSDENAVPNEEDNLINVNNILLPLIEDIPKNGNESLPKKEDLIAADIGTQSLIPSENNDYQEFRLKKMINVDSNIKISNNDDSKNILNNTLKRNVKIGINTSNDNDNNKSAKNDKLFDKDGSNPVDNCSNDNNLIENKSSYQQKSVNKKDQHNVNYNDHIDKIDIKEFNEEDLDRNADMRLKELQYKLQTLKFQNDIVLDENAKLLEILHLYKVIQSIESNEKNRMTEHNRNEQFNVNDEKNFKEEDLYNNTAKHSYNPQRNDLYQLNSMNFINQETLKNKYSNTYKIAKKSKKGNVGTEVSNKPKFKQFIDKSNLTLVNKKTYKQLYSNNEYPSNHKMNSSISNARLNEMNSNSNNISNELRQTNSNRTNNSLWIDETNKSSYNKNIPLSMTSNSNELHRVNLPNKNGISQYNNCNAMISNSVSGIPYRNNAFLEDLRKLEMTQKSEEIVERKMSRDQITTGDNVYRSIINIGDNELKHNNYEIKNDDDFYQNYESIMNYFNKYKEANAKVIENLVMLEESNETSQTLSKNKRKKTIQNLEEFYKKNVDPKGTNKDNTRYNLINSKSFSDKFNFSDLTHMQTSNIKLIPFHLIEKKKLLVNMMNYLYGKNLFQLKKTFT